MWPPAPAASAAAPERRMNLRPLASLLPYIGRYRWRALSALGALVVAALTTLIVPVAIRRMIDFGFTAKGVALIDSYFLVMIGVAAVLATASALRYYLVTTLGERVVADLRGDVFAHVTSLSSAFFDEARTGEVVSRLTADTTQIKAAAGTSISIALRNFVLFIGATAMMVVSSPQLSAFVLAAIPIIVLPLYAFGRAVRRRSRSAQDTLAEASAYAAELIGAVRVLQAFTNERHGIGRFRQSVERAYEAARNSIRSRACLTGIAIFLVRASSSCCGSARSRCWPARSRPGVSASSSSTRCLPAVRSARSPRSAARWRRLPRGRASVRNSRHPTSDRSAGASSCAAVAGAR